MQIGLQCVFYELAENGPQQMSAWSIVGSNSVIHFRKKETKPFLIQLRLK